jgi:hypothetical protein
LSKLLADRLVARAFRFRCSNCGLASDIPLELARDHVRCQGCTTEATLLGDSGEPDLAYGLNSLLDRAADQDCHGHLSVQAWMHENLDLVWSVPGAELVSTADLHREVDVIGISRSELIVAEVKNASSAFNRGVIVDSAKLAVALNADRLVLASLDDWSAGRKDLASRIATRYLPNVTVIGLSDVIQT